MTAWTFRILMAVLLVAIVFVADASDKRVHNETRIEHCALVLTEETGPRCR